MIVQYKVQQYMTNIFCDKCSLEMKLKNEVLLSNPPIYTYYCPNCKKEECSNIKYPVIEFIRLDD